MEFPMGENDVDICEEGTCTDGLHTLYACKKKKQVNINAYTNN